jgi:hypothetical protein
MTTVVVRLFFHSEEIESYKGNQGNGDENEDKTKVFFSYIKVDGSIQNCLVLFKNT